MTLNYDTTIETMAANEDVPLTDGVEAWNGGVRWTWPRRWRGIRLLKLHGSVDWLLSSPTWPPGHPGDKARRMKVRGVVRAEPGDSPWEQPGRTSPALIFGRRGKLRSEGPYLAMLNEFRRILRNETGRLIIIGYSFRDEHVNDPIREWFNCTGKPRVICVDPSLAGDPSMVVSNADKYGFAATLFAALEDPTREGPLDFCVDSDRHALIAQGAGEALRALLG